MGALPDDSGAGFFGEAGNEKRTLVESLPASAEDEADKYVDEDVAVIGQVVACDCAACCHCQRHCCSWSVAPHDIDGSDSAATNGSAIDATVIVDVDVGVVGVVVMVIVIVADDVLGEQLLAVPSCPSLLPTVPLLCLVCKHFQSETEANCFVFHARRASPRIRKKLARSERHETLSLFVLRKPTNAITRDNGRQTKETG